MPETKIQPDNQNKEEKKTKKGWWIPLVSVLGSLVLVIGGVIALALGIRGCSSTATEHEHIAEPAVRENEVAATCEQAGSYDEVVFCKTCHQELSREHKTINALGHAYVHHNAKAASCIEKGHIEYYSCERCIKVFDTSKTEITKDSQYIGTIDHDYETPTYTWNSDYSLCVAEMICKHGCGVSIREESENITSVETIIPTCSSEGQMLYTAIFSDTEHFSTQNKTKVLPALEHNYLYQEMVWDDLNHTAQARYECDYCHDTKDEDAEVTGPVLTPATCFDDEYNTYTATHGSNVDHKHYTNENTAGHIWGAVSYVWNSDHTSCTATKTCSRDSSHVISETVSGSAITSEVTDPATHDENGNERFTADFTGTAHPELGSTYEDVVIPKDTNHNMSFHPAGASAPTCTSVGVIDHYQCSICNKMFSDEAGLFEVTDISTPALGHDYNVVYAWASDHSSCTATGTCSRCGDIINETASGSAITLNTTLAPKCEEDGTGDYTAHFANPYIDDDTVSATLPQTGHSYAGGLVEYEWNDDHTVCTGKIYCVNPGCTHFHSENATTISSVESKAVTCTEAGEITYTATFAGSEYFDTITDKVTIDALNHNYDDSITSNVTYSWVDTTTGELNKAVKCTHDTSHVQNSTVTSNLRVTVQSGNGEVEVTQGYGLEVDEEITVTAIPGAGQKFVGWYTNSTLTGKPVSTSATYTFEMPSGTYSLYADFNDKAPGSIPLISTDKAYFGLYPQSQVGVYFEEELDTAKPSLTPDEKNGYYFYKGTYYAEYNDLWYECEVIEWRILDQYWDDDLNAYCFYLMSEMILDQCIFDDENNNYENSVVREFLNGEFYDRAFAYAAEDVIATMNVDNSGVYPSSPDPNPNASNNTNDKVTMLSVNELYHVYTDPTADDSSKRKALNTEYASAKGINQSEDGYGHYWTRTPSWGYISDAHDCYITGNAYNAHVYDTKVGVRPVIKIIA